MRGTDLDPALFAKGWLKKLYREGPHFQFMLRQLLKSGTMSPEALQRHQLDRLRKMLGYCNRHIPYYQDLFKRHRIRPENFQSLADMERIPFLNKQLVKENFDKLTATKGRNFLAREARTSGTTGMPGKFLRDYESINFENAAVWRQWKQTGGANKRRITIRGEQVVPLSQHKPPFWKSNPASQELLMSGYHLSAENSLSYIRKIVSYQPAVLSAYPSSAYLLARFFREHHVKYAFSAIHTSSETLDPAARQYIEDTFQCPVHDWYGQAERVSAIAQCALGTYHVQEDYSFTELLQEGSQYEIVGTHFCNRLMPLIRYRTGDFTRPSSETCACGSHFRIVEQIAGRFTDVLITPEGKPVPNVPALALRNIETDGIFEVQFVQEAPGEVLLYVVPSDKYTDSDRMKLTEATREHTAPTMSVQVIEVPNIDRGPNGKFISVINRCNQIRQAV